MQHDHGGNVTAEIGYTTNPQNLKLSGPGQPPTRWTMPAHWHNVTQHFEVGGKQVELEVLLFDSCVMVGNSDVVNEDGSVTELKLSELPGPPDPAMAAEQLQWLEHKMSTSTSDYLWVGAHYPVWAIGHDPPTGVEETLRPLLNKWLVWSCPRAQFLRLELLSPLLAVSSARVSFTSLFRFHFLEQSITVVTSIGVTGRLIILMDTSMTWSISSRTTRRSTTYLLVRMPIPTIATDLSKTIA